MSGSEPGIVFRSEMSNSFQVTRVLIVLDHRVLYHREAKGGRALPPVPFLPIATPTPGEHELQVLTQLRGHGEGDASYLDGYKFEVKSSHRFTVKENKAIRIEVIAWERGDQGTPFEQRPAVRFIEALAPLPVPSPEPSAAVPAATSDVPAGAPSARTPVP